MQNWWSTRKLHWICKYRQLLHRSECPNKVLYAKASPFSSPPKLARRKDKSLTLHSSWLHYTLTSLVVFAMLQLYTASNYTLHEAQTSTPDPHQQTTFDFYTLLKRTPDNFPHLKSLVGLRWAVLKQEPLAIFRLSNTLRGTTNTKH